MKTTTPNTALDLARSKLSAADRRAILRSVIRIMIVTGLTAAIGSPSRNRAVDAGAALTNPHLVQAVSFCIAGVLGCTSEEGCETFAIGQSTAAELSRLLAEAPDEASTLLRNIVEEAGGAYLSKP